METSKRSAMSNKRRSSGFRVGVVVLVAPLTLAFATTPRAQAPTPVGRQAAPTTAQVTQPPQTNQPQSPASAPPTAATSAALVTELNVNNLKVLIKRRAGSQTVTAGLFLRGGSRNITAENAGVEALMLSAATEASTSFPRQALRAELARTGTLIGQGVNQDYSALTLGTTRANFDRSWRIFTDVALRPAFAREDFERVKQQIVVSLRDDTSTPESYLRLLQDRVAYAGHPYLQRPQGTAETVARLTVADVRRYHQQMMQTTRLLLVIVGDLDPARLEKEIAASFGQLPRGDYRPQPPPLLSFAAPSVDVTSRNLPTNYIQGLFVAPSLTSPDIHPMRVATTILKERVFEEVRNKRNLSYAPDAFLASQGANVGGIYVTAVNGNEAVRVMLDEIARLQRDPIRPQDITAVSSQFLTTYYLNQETNAAQAGELATYELIGGGWRNSLDVLDRLRAVTPADVQRVAQTYMRNIRFVVLGDPARVDKNVFINQGTD